MANESNCLLGKRCKLAGNEEKCHSHCPLFIALHGSSGNNGRVGYSRIPQEHKTRTIANAPAREDETDAFLIIDKYAQSFKRFFIENPTPKERIKNLYLYSENKGNGKTSTASCLLNTFLAIYYIECLKRNMTPMQRPVYFVSMNSLQKDFLQMTRSGVPKDVSEEAGERYYESLEYAKKAELIVMDDIGTRSVSEAFRNDILDLVDYRQARLKPIIFTSNLPLEELPNLFGEERLFDRIRDLCLTIEFKSDSKRGRRT